MLAISREPFRGGGGAVLVAARDRGGNGRRQQLRDEQRIPVAGILDGDAQQRRRDRLVAFGQAQHREAGLRILAEARGAFERVRGGGKVTAAELDLAELVPRLPDVRGVPLLHRDHHVAQLGLGARPVTPQPGDLGPVHPAVARKVAHAGTARAHERLLGPLGRAADVAERLTHADRVAVDARRHDRAEETRHRADHRLVDEAQPLGERGPCAPAPCRIRPDLPRSRPCRCRAGRSAGTRRSARPRLRGRARGGARRPRADRPSDRAPHTVRHLRATARPVGPSRSQSPRDVGSRGRSRG